MIVESWKSAEALRVHASAEPLTQFNAAVAGLLAAAMDVVVPRPVDLGSTEVDA